MTRLLTAVCLCALALPLHAQNYPSRPIRFICPYVPGGAGEGDVKVARFHSTRVQRNSGDFHLGGRAGDRNIDSFADACQPYRFHNRGAETALAGGSLRDGRCCGTA